MNGVGLTSLWVAAMRAEESERADGWFRDPYARALAGERGLEVLRAMEPARGPRPPTIPVRTRFLDERIAQALAGGLRQIVILAAGMDSRAFRLEWPSDAVVYEIDQPAVLDYKAGRLTAEPGCERRVIALDLAEDWAAALVARGFDPQRPTLWLIEGLLPYLPPHAVPTLFARVDALSSAGSIALFDCLGRSVLDSPYMASMLDAVAKLGAPWQFGTDEPETLLDWDVRVHELSALGHSYGRWPFPAMPRGTPGVPQSFLVTAEKR